MSRKSLLQKWFLPVAAVLMILPACRRETDVSDDENTLPPPASRNVQETPTPGTGDQQIEFRASVQADLREIEAQIEQLDARAENLSEDAQADFDRQRQRLEELRSEARVRLQQLDTATGEAAQSAREGVNNALTELRQAYDEAVQTLETAGETGVESGEPAGVTQPGDQP